MNLQMEDDIKSVRYCWFKNVNLQGWRHLQKVKDCNAMCFQATFSCFILINLQPQ